MSASTPDCTLKTVKTDSGAAGSRRGCLSEPGTHGFTATGAAHSTMSQLRADATRRTLVDFPTPARSVLKNSICTTPTCLAADNKYAGTHPLQCRLDPSAHLLHLPFMHGAVRLARIGLNVHQWRAAHLGARSMHVDPEPVCWRVGSARSGW